MRDAMLRGRKQAPMTGGNEPHSSTGGGALPEYRAIRALTFTTLYPNPAQASHGVFVENRLRHLLAGGRVASRVVAPVPWFPLAGARFGRYGAYARVPRVERRHGIEVRHPRYLVLPKLGMSAAPGLLFAASLAALRAARDEFDIIDAHYFYPDGVAAALLGRCLGKPVVITARGTDVNLIPRYRLPRAMILWAARQAAGIVTVSRALKDALVELGVPAERIRVLRNGVDLALFRPHDRAAARATLGLQGPTLLSVGLLIERKGHDLVIGALPRLPGFGLLIAGEGPERAALEALAARLGVADRVRFLGSVPHDELPRLYSAADALVLASSREGWANVLLEALACGTPVVASPIWGNPEVVAQPDAGILMTERSAAGVAEAVGRLFRTLPDRERTRRYAEDFSWEETTDGQVRLFEEILGRRAPAPVAQGFLAKGLPGCQAGS
jgi:teichuronic acid biosynthesis glycosyltransferase TuaC